MLKLFLFLLLSVSFLQAMDKVEIYASSLETKDGIVNANGEVVVVYKEYFLNAKRAVYHKESGVLELFDNIRVTHGVDYKILGNYAKLNIAEKERLFQPFFMLDKTSKVWISAKEGCAKDLDVEIKSGTMSGCDPNDPLWKMEFSSSEYNTQTKWLNLYNTRIYIYDIPVFYTPYFGFSFNTTRRTGFLVPSIGISDKEGFYYEQPIYIAEQNWWDLELKPQIRTNRGSGIYSTFRFLDSKTSKGQLTVGYFKEKEKYFVDNDLAIDLHYGFNFKYNNNNFINQWFGTQLRGQSALYVDINNMSDVDYINLSNNDTTKNATSTQVLSRVNLFYNTDVDYYGAYFKYYKDLTKDTNEKTLQKLPTFQYHYYLDTLLKNTLLYSLDMQSNNIYRVVGKRVIQTDVNVPVTLQTSIFDEYINLSYTSQFYAQHSQFGGEEEYSSDDEYENGLFARQYNIFKLSTQLTRAYDEFTHVTGFAARYTAGGSEYRDGFYDYNKDFCSDLENKDDPRCEFYNVTNVDNELQLEFSQYIFDKTSKQKIYHRLAQILSYDNSKSDAGELENELDYQITKSINYYNNMFYNYNEKSFSKIFNKLSFIANGFNISLSHLYKNTFLEETDTDSPYTSYVTSSARYTYDEHYSYSMRLNYDIETSLKKSAEVGFLYRKRCWDFGLRYVENNRPILGQTNSASTYDRYIYFTILLKPLMPSKSATSDTSIRLQDVLKGS